MAKTMDTTHEDVTSFYDTDLSTESHGLPSGLMNKGVYYHLTVTEAAVGSWDDGRPNLEIHTKVATGEFEGEFGPRKTFSIGGYEGKTGEGRKFVISAADQAKDLLAFVRAAHSARLQTRNVVGFDSAGAPVGVDEGLLHEISEIIEGCEVIALVKTDKNGYMRMSKYSAVDSPPEGFSVPGALDFSLNG